MDKNTTPMEEGGNPADKRVKLDVFFTAKQKKELEQIAKAEGLEIWQVAVRMLELNMTDNN